MSVRTYTITAMKGDHVWIVGKGYRSIKDAERAQARMYAARAADDDTDYVIG